MPVACDSGQCFGIELETSRCHGYKALRGHTCFGAKYDSSVSGMEFISPILSGDTGLDEVKAFCNKAKELNFAVDGDCGFHLHLDMRSMSNEQRRHIAYAYRITYTIWMRLVNSYRAHDCSYCRAPRYAPSDILDAVHFDDFCYECSRYEFVNLSAYSSHRTLEIRGYQGTLNPVEIINWIEAHLRFVEYVKDKPFEELARLDWAAFKKIIGPDLARYYGRKRAGSIPAERPWQATRQCADFDLTSSN